MGFRDYGFKVSKSRGSFLGGVLKTRSIAFGGLSSGPPICGNYHLSRVYVRFRLWWYKFRV